MPSWSGSSEAPSKRPNRPMKELSFAVAGLTDAGFADAGLADAGLEGALAFADGSFCLWLNDEGLDGSFCSWCTDCLGVDLLIEREELSTVALEELCLLTGSLGGGGGASLQRKTMTSIVPKFSRNTSSVSSTLSADTIIHQHRFQASLESRKFIPKFNPWKVQSLPKKLPSGCFVSFCLTRKSTSV